ncbi:MAG: 50S ribosomal protein L18 [Candidatus Parcubacteria bacterium]|nr:50S ribosomal protein L18 [Candidatus Parcubacteria bacterium]
MNTKEIKNKQYRRQTRVRAKISGNSDRPRLSVFRSTAHIYGQLIDDEKELTILSFGDKDLKTKVKEVKGEGDKKMVGKVAVAFHVGKALAEKAKEKNIKKVIFDRGKYAYHGRVEALAEGAREGGLEF